MQTITLSDKTLSHLRQVAALRGLEADAYAEELLEISLAVLQNNALTVTAKPRRAMEFSASAPTGRTAAEIDAEIEASRAEWSDETADALRDKATS